MLLGVDDGHDEVDDVARGAKLAGVALGAHHRQQVLERVAQPLGVVVFEFVDDLQERAQGLGIAVGQVGVVEDAAEQRRDAGVLRNPVERLGIEIQRRVSAQPRVHQSWPAVTVELVHEEAALAAQILALRVDVPHELIDQRNGDLLDLGLGIGNLAHQDVAGGCRCGVWSGCLTWMDRIHRIRICSERTTAGKVTNKRTSAILSILLIHVQPSS